MGAVVLALVLVVFIAKPWTRSAALDMIRTIIYVNYRQERNDAQPTVRDYAVPDADSDEDDKEGTSDVKVSMSSMKQKSDVTEDDIEGDEEDPMLTRNK